LLNLKACHPAGIIRGFGGKSSYFLFFSCFARRARFDGGVDRRRVRGRARL